MFRSLRPAKLSAVSVILCLALGIGVNAAFFSAMTAVFLRPFPYHDSDRLIVVWASNSFTERRGLDGAIVDAWRVSSRTVADAAAFSLTPIRFSLGAADSQELAAGYVSAGLFSLLGVHPVLGRTFRSDDVDGGAVAVVSYGFWQARLGGDPEPFHRVIVIDDVAYRVIGVMPRGFFFPDYNVSVWIPLFPSDARYRQVQGIARLQTWSTASQARDELRWMLRSRLETPRLRTAEPPGVFPLADLVLRNHRGVIWTLYGISVLLLVAACMNAAQWFACRNLWAFDAVVIRNRLGATVHHLVIACLVEPVFIVASGGILSLAVAFVVLKIVRSWAALTVPRLESASIDLAGLAYATALSVVVAVVGGIAPLLTARGVWARERTVRRTTAPRGASRLRYSLLTAEIAATFMLLVMTGLLGRSLVELVNLDWGFDADRTAVAEVILPDAVARNPHLRAQFTEEVLDKLMSQPAILAAGMGYGVPIRWMTWFPKVVSVGERRLSVATFGVSRGYFAALGIPLQGRDLECRDTLGRAGEVVASDSFAQNAWPGLDPLGRRIQFLRVSDSVNSLPREELTADLLRRPESWVTDGASWEVIGIVPDVKTFGLRESTGPTLYICYSSPHAGLGARLSFAVKAKSGTSDGMRGLLRVIDSAGRDTRVVTAFRMSDVVARTVAAAASPQVLTIVAGFITVFAVFLAGTGVYGVVSLVAAQASFDIAVRRALGASRGDITRLLMRDASYAIATGVALGGVASLGSAGLLRAVLFQVSPTDYVAYAFAAVVTITVCCLGLAPPMYRALGKAPFEVLRGE